MCRTVGGVFFLCRSHFKGFHLGIHNGNIMIPLGIHKGNIMLKTKKKLLIVAIQI